MSGYRLGLPMCLQCFIIYIICSVNVAVSYGEGRRKRREGVKYLILLICYLSSSSSSSLLHLVISLSHVIFLSPILLFQFLPTSLFYLFVFFFLFSLLSVLPLSLFTSPSSSSSSIILLPPFSHILFISPSFHFPLCHFSSFHSFYARHKVFLSFVIFLVLGNMTEEEEVMLKYHHGVWVGGKFHQVGTCQRCADVGGSIVLNM